MVRTTKIVTDATRRKILNAAEVCFCRSGISGTTLQSVATQAGVTRGAVYWHFVDKEDLLKGVVERMSFPLLNELKRINYYRNQPVISLRNVLLESLTTVLKNNQLKRLVRIVYFSDEYLRLSKTIGGDMALDEIELVNVFSSIIRRSKELKQTESYVNDKRLSCLIFSVYFSVLKSAVTMPVEHWVIREGIENLKWVFEERVICQQCI
ncbi:TetR family transcriptional regulator [Pantoea agglomerans]|uniref:TetR family transcriptional regulator n=1 Tax=Enterobacter agglomerans TaxID=549 RepID=UPI0012AD3794|nr:TetR family transcriptional regulator [Pantoea agglomerans]MRT10464.1 TetR family transcriptional regulator [Pantoea agglomerans]